jgi:hypothetical protein
MISFDNNHDHDDGGEFITLQPVVPTGRKRQYKTNNRFCTLPPEILEYTLAVKFGVTVETTQKVIESVRVVIKLFEIYGLAGPRDSTWFIRKLKKDAKIVYSTSYQMAWKMNRDYYETVCLILQYVSVHGENSWVKLLKWKFSAFFAFWNNQDLPKRPWDEDRSKIQFFNPEVLLPAQPNIYFVGMVEEQRIELIDAVLILKKGMPAVSKEMLKQAALDTKVQLTTSRADEEEIKISLPGDQIKVITRVHLENELRRTITELFGTRPLLETDILNPSFPSINACYSNTKFMGGALGDLLNAYGDGVNNAQHYEDCLVDDGSGNTTLKLDRGLSKNEPLVSFGAEAARFFDPVVFPYKDPIKVNENMFSSERLYGYELPAGQVLCADTRQLDDAWREFHYDLFEQAKAEPPYVECVAIAEPLKVRVISKGPSKIYAALKPMQKWLWGVLKKEAVFALIGEKVTERHLNEAIGKLMDGFEVVSGDYSAATDNLRSWVSEVLLDQLMIEIGENFSKDELARLPKNYLYDLKVMMRTALTRHVFHGDDGSELPQKKMVSSWGLSSPSPSCAWLMLLCAVLPLNWQMATFID